jgi:hypothetical protein
LRNAASFTDEEADSDAGLLSLPKKFGLLSSATCSGPVTSRLVATGMLLMQIEHERFQGLANSRMRSKVLRTEE